MALRHPQAPDGWHPGAVLSRRTLLAGGAAIVVAAGGTGLGLARAWEVGVTLGPGDPGVPDVASGPVLEGRFRSPYRPGVGVEWALVRPPDVGGELPVVVGLHGHGGSAAALLGGPWQVGRFLAAAVAAGVPPFALVVISTGNGFYHPRPDGEDGGALVTEELLPRLERRGLLPQGRRIGLLGWSMGGYGALRLGGLLGPGRVAAVAASSPGLYLDPAAAHPDGFADPAEYQQYSVMDDQADLDGIAVRVDIGDRDVFTPAVRAYVDGFPATADLTTVVTTGGHDLPYYHRAFPDLLAWMGGRMLSA